MRKRLVKNVLVILLIVISFIVISFSKNTFAKPASEQKSPVDTSLTKHLEYPSILDLLPNNLRDGNEIYIPREYLRKEASILCSYKGTSLPGRKDTAVKSGGKSARYRIDDPIKGANKGKETGFLTLEDKGATVYNDGTDYINQKNPFSETHSKTYGKFSIVDIYSLSKYGVNNIIIDNLDIISINKFNDNKYYCYMIKGIIVKFIKNIYI